MSKDRLSVWLPLMSLPALLRPAEAVCLEGTGHRRLGLVCHLLLALDERRVLTADTGEHGMQSTVGVGGDLARVRVEAVEHGFGAAVETTLQRLGGRSQALDELTE